MKNKLYIFILSCIVVLSFASCKDMLEENSYGKPTAGEILSDPENVYSVVGQVYAELKWMQDHWNLFGALAISTDEVIIPTRNPDGDWDDSGYWSKMGTMTWDPTTLSLEYVWNTCQSGAVMCNNVLSQLEDNQEYIDEENYNAAVAELIIMRSFYYYMLYDCFGTIPYARSFGDKVTSKPLATETEGWCNLVNDLLDNVDAMPAITPENRAEYYGRASQGLGFGLLSRLMLNAESFKVNFADPNVAALAQRSVRPLNISSAADCYKYCVDFCDEVINAQSYELESSYFNNFLTNNESSTENILVIVNSPSNTFDKDEVAGRQINKNRLYMLTLFMSFVPAWDLYSECWNGICARESFLQKFAAEDVRGLCNGDPSKGPAGTAIDFTVEANKRGWFIGPVYAPDNYIGETMDDGQGRKIIVWTEKMLPSSDYLAADKFDLSGTATYDWNNMIPCASIITADIPNTSTDPSAVLTNQVSGARCLKYEIAHNTSGTVNEYGDNDFVLMRYAEILFNKAEAALRAGDDAAYREVLPQLQQIQQRAGVSASSSPVGGATVSTYDLSTTDGLIEERAREFYLEFLRRRDLIRQGQYAEGTWQFKTAKKSHYNWFPIPQQYLNNSGGNWSQREGY